MEISIKTRQRFRELERLLGQAHAEIDLLKKAFAMTQKEGPGGEIKTDTEGRYMTIQDAQSGGLRVANISILSITRSESQRLLQMAGTTKKVPYVNMDLKNQIQEIALEFTGYGYRRMTAELRYRGYVVNHKRVLDLMRQDNLLCLKKRFKPITTDSSHGLPVYPNLLKNIKITGLNQAWVSDITYVQLLHEHIYLAVILDLYSRKCIGWELSRNIDHRLAMQCSWLRH